MSTTLHPTSTAVIPLAPQHLITADCAGLRMSLAEFDEHEEWDPGYRYELIQGVLIVNPAPAPDHQRGLGEVHRWLANFKEDHPQGSAIDELILGWEVYLPESRRIADLNVWCGLGREPDYRHDPATILIEFVSPGRQQWLRDYREKRDEYLALGVQEYWVFNRFDRTLTVFRPGPTEHVLAESETYRTPLLPDFELPLAKIFAKCGG